MSLSVDSSLETLISLLPAYKPIQPAKGRAFVSTVFLASKVPSPLHAPVTMNDAKPSYFQMDVHSQVLTHHLRFPVVPVVNP